MVLHHVAQRARAVVVVGAAFEPDGFRDRDLHMVDPLRRPQWLEHRIGEAQRDQVLDRFLAQIMIDAVDRRFLDHRADFVVDPPRRGQVGADRLFDHQARERRDEALLDQAPRDRPEEFGRRREIDDAHIGIAAFERVGECWPALLAFRIQRHMAQPRQKTRPERLLVRRQLRAQIFLDEFAVGRIVEVLARDGDDPRLGRNLAIGIAMPKSGQQFARGEVARSAEHDAIERGDGNDL